ncbi:uncharacterized protein CTHT_0053020 [Thermochaetoides thermophila DSM 1495]|uniref:Enoyl reductase (ER) domain-containing protein n=1 Tax=Chaetomium thermophilum (strain DSM 1495 / CBS 144.50 / IMI 039719) TaxID=759272 RepID=G0SDU4_CHATD|nr:hypothetical protein CTHT_0053020 [Thermochaetoides thermophila DSM 1495]EGS18695.1 hypothetical protein CTHT_0053020 [Thermochaetoides thermophila DSM 1495]
MRGESPSQLPDLNPLALTCRIREGDDNEWTIQRNAWPSKNIPTKQRVYLVNVLAVTLHAGEVASISDADVPRLQETTIPGYEFAGVIIGPPNSGGKFAPGDSVYGRTSFGRVGNARTFMFVKENELAKMPAEIQWSHAARIPLGGLIGYQALFSTDTIQKPSITDGWGSERGEAYQRNSKRTVLITGAGCMAGLWAIELAKLAGNTEAGRLENCQEADTPKVDMIIDFVGNGLLSNAWWMLKKKGTFVSMVDDALACKPPATGNQVRLVNFRLKSDPEALEVITTLINDRKSALIREINQIFDERDEFDIYDHPTALQHVRGNSRGIVVLKIPQLPIDNQTLVWERFFERVGNAEQSDNGQVTQESDVEDDRPSRLSAWLREDGPSSEKKRRRKLELMIQRENSSDSEGQDSSGEEDDESQ